MDDLRADPEREGKPTGTGLFVRAKQADGRWGSVDIAELDTVSLQSWLRSRGGENQWAEDVVLILLGHDPYDLPGRKDPHGRL